jgi:hypothetical protein
MLSKTRAETRVVTVTPEMAEKLLEGNVHNRPVYDHVVQNYADMMRRKMWQLNGESVVVDYTGKLLDGQHRLWACFNAKTAFETVLVTGVDPDTFVTIDTGKKRSSADVLHISGIVKNAATVAAAAVICLEYRRGTLKVRGSASHGRRVVTRQDVLTFVEKNRQLELWVEKARESSDWTRSYAANMAAVLYLASHKYRELAEEFMIGWKTGENLGSKSPILALRNRLGTVKRMAKSERIALIIYAWNCFVEKKPLQILRAPKLDDLVIKGTERDKT